MTGYKRTLLCAILAAALMVPVAVGQNDTDDGQDGSADVCRQWYEEHHRHGHDPGNASHEDPPEECREPDEDPGDRCEAWYEEHRRHGHGPENETHERPPEECRRSHEEPRHDDMCGAEARQPSEEERQRHERREHQRFHDFRNRSHDRLHDLMDQIHQAWHDHNASRENATDDENRTADRNRTRWTWGNASNHEELHDGMDTFHARDHDAWDERHQRYHDHQDERRDRYEEHRRKACERRESQERPDDGSGSFGSFDVEFDPENGTGVVDGRYVDFLVDIESNAIRDITVQDRTWIDDLSPSGVFVSGGFSSGDEDEPSKMHACIGPEEHHTEEAHAEGNGSDDPDGTTSEEPREPERDRNCLVFHDSGVGLIRFDIQDDLEVYLTVPDHVTVQDHDDGLRLRVDGANDAVLNGDVTYDGADGIVTVTGRARFLVPGNEIVGEGDDNETGGGDEVGQARSSARESAGEESGLAAEAVVSASTSSTRQVAVQDLTYDDVNVQIDPAQQSDGVEIEFGSDAVEGARWLAFDVDPSLLEEDLGDLATVEVTYYTRSDGTWHEETIEPADSVEDITDCRAEEGPEYLVTVGEEKVQLLVCTTFSVHKVHVQGVAAATEDPTTLPGPGSALVVLTVALAAVWVSRRR